MFLTSVAPITMTGVNTIVMMSLWRCWKLAGSPPVSLICSIGKLPFLLAGPEWGGAHMAWEKYAGIKTEKEHEPRISIEKCWRRGSHDIGEFMNGKRDKNHETVLFAFATWINLQYHSEEWTIPNGWFFACYLGQSIHKVDNKNHGIRSWEIDYLDQERSKKLDCYISNNDRSVIFREKK